MGTRASAYRRDSDFFKKGRCMNVVFLLLFLFVFCVSFVCLMLFSPKKTNVFLFVFCECPLLCV